MQKKRSILKKKEGKLIQSKYNNNWLNSMNDYHVINELKFFSVHLIMKNIIIFQFNLWIPHKLIFFKNKKKQNSAPLGVH